jgi:hypothetical protein
MHFKRVLYIKAQYVLENKITSTILYASNDVLHFQCKVHVLNHPEYFNSGLLVTRYAFREPLSLKRSMI